MPLIFNLRHLEKRTICLEGEISPEELELTGVDEMIQVTEPVRYDLILERLNQSVLVQGSLKVQLECECVRCLQPFSRPLVLDPWLCDLPLEGEDRVPVENDFVDLTPFVREDILLAFPQHPLCEPDCRGLLATERNSSESTSVDDQAIGSPSAWAELNKLKF